ncbi:Asp-tRNA(Asn)/Glu-tRNA(Gln) amidotransferase subunit GatC [Peptoniphilus sp. GNH]|nr:aspartyl/glutamyl-tRNA(Asn/Gln) amidotransferase, C subunit [Clostridiales bacterium KA00134]UHR02574.1 Asp-tRNA(Asn)/Glu-tRNA(Gln) amidotransferase subunit GatC [Peptoniphilus sp. GNH]
MKKEDIKHIAEIAYLSFSEEGIERFSKDFSETMDLIEKIKSVDTEGIDPTIQVSGIYNNLRDDQEKESLSQEDALKNTQGKKYGYFDIIKFVE